MSIRLLALCALALVTFAQNGVDSRRLELPTVIHFCAQHCITLTLENGRFANYTNLPGQSNVKRVFVVESFTKESVIFRRTDTGSNPLTAVYRGAMSSDGNSIRGDGWQMAWGAALDSVAGSDEERARRQAASVAVPPGVEAGSSQPAIPAGNIDLSGTWQQDPATTRFGFPPMKILIVQLNNDLVGVNLEPEPFLAHDAIFLEATRDGADSAKSAVQGFNDSGVVQWFHATLRINDSDHFEAAGKAAAAQTRFTRVAKATPAGTGCDEQTAANISGVEALARGWLNTLYAKNATPAACWYRIGAERGDVEVQMMFGDALRRGRGVPKNIQQAVKWLQKAGMQGSYIADRELGEMFRDGEGVPSSQQREDYWFGRAEWIDPKFVHTKNFMPTTKWATDTSGPCDPANPGHLDEDSIWRSGRVAFEARSGDAAVCWFKMSSAQGAPRANTYLGVIYFFGIGVEKNQALGLEYLRKAADSKDPFAMMYLSNFYHYGMGVKVDLAQWVSLMREVDRMPKSFEVVRRVQGISGLAVRDGYSRDRQACDDAKREERQGDHQSQVRAAFACQNLDLLSSTMTSGQHTVGHPEEIFPEIFDPISPPYKEKWGLAERGWIRFTP